jgi:molybdopterin synthase catalytic subunit
VTGIAVGIVDTPLLPAMGVGPVSASGHGAQVQFWGLVRDVHEGRRVLAVTYDAFRTLAEATLRTIALEARARFGPGLSVAVYHRIGRLPVGEASVVVGVGSLHREAAYQASRQVIEEIRVRLPVRKQEHYSDGNGAWLAGHSLRPDAREGR